MSIVSKAKAMMAKKMKLSKDDSSSLRSYSRTENGKKLYRMPEGTYKPKNGRYYLSHETPKIEIHG